MKPQRRTNRNCRFIRSTERVDGDDLPEHLRRFAEPLVAGDLNSRRLPPSRLREKVLGTKPSKNSFKEQLAEARKQRLQREMESREGGSYGKED